MPVGLHLFLMIVTMMVAFFVCGFAGFARAEELEEAGLPSWSVHASPFVGALGAVLLFRLIPARCPGCGWPVAFLRFGEKLIYRCWSCRHVHCTIWGHKSREEGPHRTRVRLLRFSLDEPGIYRVTFSGHVYRPCTPVLSVWPAPPRGAESELQTQIEVQVISEQGESLASVAGPVKEWDGERIYFPWRTNLDLSHSDWQDIALPGSGNFALEVSVSQVDSQGQSLQAQAALDFRQGSG